MFQLTAPYQGYAPNARADEAWAWRKERAIVFKF